MKRVLNLAAAAALPLILQDNDRRHSEHPLLSLMARPNAAQGKADFFEALYGYAAEHALGRPVTDLTVAPGDDDLAHRIMQTLRSEGQWQGAFRVARADGSTFRARVRDIVMCDAEGRASGEDRAD